MPRPPESVVSVARHHWMTGGAMLVLVALVYVFARELRPFELSLKGYAIALGIAAVYLATGSLVWRGATPGRYLSYACSLIYLSRPLLGLRVWRLMGTAEFKMHFGPPAQTVARPPLE